MTYKRKTENEPILIHDIDLFSVNHYGISTKNGIFLYCKDELLAESLALFFSKTILRIENLDSCSNETILNEINKIQEEIDYIKTFINRS